MPTVTLLEKAYGRYTRAAINSLKQTLTQLTAGLNVNVKIESKDERDWIRIHISGEDEAVTLKYLDREFGLAPVSIQNLHVGAVIRGKVIDSGQVGYGLYIDIGISSPELRDALLPLYKMRAQLAEGRKLPANQIIKKLCLFDNFPLKVRVTSVNSETNKIEVELTKNQLSMFNRWIKSKLDYVIALGATRAHIKKALTKTRHLRDVLQIQHLGLLEHAIQCKPKTYSPGIIAKIGPLLPQVPLYTFNPKEAGKIMCSQWAGRDLNPRSSGVCNISAGRFRPS